MKKVCIAATVLALVLSGCGESERPRYYSADYELVPSLDKNKQKKLTIEEIVSFDCEHCYKFIVNVNPKLKAEYGDRLNIVPLPLVFNKQTQFPVRLFIVGQKEGKGNDIVELLLKKRFEGNEDIFDENVVLDVANHFGLKEKYQAEKNANWVEEIYQENRSRGMKYGISQTPTLIVEGQLKITNIKIDNVKNVVNDLLE